MRKSILSKAARLALLLALVLTLLAPTVSAADYYAIVDDFGKKARTAYMDVAADTLSGAGSRPDVLFNVYDTNGHPITEFSLATNHNGFVSTASFGNFFDMWGGQPILVRARTPSAAANSAATLYIDSQGAPMTIGLLPTLRGDTPFGMGQLFSIALGNFQSASLLIANVSGGDQGAEVFLGTVGAPGSGIHTNGRIRNHGIWRIDLTQNEARSNVVVRATGLVIVQVVIDDGRSIQAFTAAPSY